MSDEGSNSSDTTFDFTAYDNAATAIYFLLFIFIVPLNILVIYAMLKSKKRKSREHLFILHLAIADLSVGAINVLGDGIVSSMYHTWYGGDLLCRIFRYLKVVNIIVSNDLIIGLSVDRYLAVAFPMMVMRRGSILYKALVIIAWAVAFVVGIFFLIYSKEVDTLEGTRCHIHLPDGWWKPYLIVVTLFVYILPTILITLCYIGITTVVWQKWKENPQLSELSKPEQGDDKTRQADSSQGFWTEAKVKSLKMNFVVCIAFFLCWTPYFVISLLSVYNHLIDPALYTILSSLYCLNSLCNPLVFILFNKELFLPKHLCRKQTGMDAAAELETLESN